jgi:hypothetical protein
LNQKVLTDPRDRWEMTPLDDAIRHKQDDVAKLFGTTKGDAKKVA